MSSTNMNSRRGVPVPHSATSARARPWLEEAAQQRGRDVAVLRIVIVARTVEVGRHRGDEVAAVLPPVRLAQLDARDLGDRIPFVGRLERAGQQFDLPASAAALARG